MVVGVTAAVDVVAGANATEINCMLIAAGIVFIDYSENQVWFYIYCSIPAAILILICWKKGENAKWCWRNKEG